MINLDDEILSYIDIDYITSIMKRNKGKKFFCFGGGSAAQILMEKLPPQYKIEAFLDNNTKLHGEKICGTVICSPDILKKVKKGEYIVFILSWYIYEISRQLEAMDLQAESGYYDIYTKFLAYYRSKKFERIINQFLDFIDRIPTGYFDSIPICREQHMWRLLWDYIGEIPRSA